jgi:hypothetical protein
MLINTIANITLLSRTMKTSIFFRHLFLLPSLCRSSDPFQILPRYKNLSLYPYNKSIHPRHSYINDFVSFAVFRQEFLQDIFKPVWSRVIIARCPVQHPHSDWDLRPCEIRHDRAGGYRLHHWVCRAASILCKYPS